MSKKFLGKMTAGVVLGGAASLLIGAPGIAASGALENGSATGSAKASGGERHEERHGWIYSERKFERRDRFDRDFDDRRGHRGFDRDFDDRGGHRGFGRDRDFGRFGRDRDFDDRRFGHRRFFRNVREIWIVQICKERQPAPWVASRVTGRLWQKPSVFRERLDRRGFGRDGRDGRGFDGGFGGFGGFDGGFGGGFDGFDGGFGGGFDGFDGGFGGGFDGFDGGFGGGFDGGFDGGFGGGFDGKFGGDFGRGEDFGRGDLGRKDFGKGERRDFKGKREFTHPWAYWTSFRVPEWVRPGVYKAWGSCGEGRIFIHPFGHIEAGGGGTAGGDNSNTALAGGAGLLAASAIGGAALWRRRMADGTVR
jgi:hypothetical protein